MLLGHNGPTGGLAQQVAMEVWHGERVSFKQQQITVVALPLAQTGSTALAAPKYHAEE